ncbi:BTAD domain-containing putative transcriptional regulator [Streptomyces sp. NPDC088766]|uniref:BTAD domain-containing putative transcriptional regulator n=1 Tax=Streptomyces sp. NPDC088766 TaxID=3365893 RepID=UPI0038160977
MKFCLLGPLEVRRGVQVLDLGPPMRRALLLRLLLENGRTVGVTRLCDDLWNGRPPPSALSSVHAHISRLRAVLEPGRARRDQAEVLRSVPGGYVLHQLPDELDSVRFERAVQQAHTLASAGRVDAARREIERALAMWRGTPLLDAAGHRFAEGEAGRLEGLRLSAEELRTALLLQEGNVTQAIIGTERLVERDPLREASWALLMRALYAAGRHAEALRCYETVRTLLARDLGLDPGPALRETQMAILRHDTELLRPPFRSVAPVCGTVPAVPAVPLADDRWQVPEREKELDRLTRMLRDAAAGSTGWAVVSGEPGAGKSRVAGELARRAAETGADVVHVRCTSGSHPATRSPDRQMRTLAETLEQLAEGAGTSVPVLCVVEDVHLASAEVRTLLSLHARTLRDAALAVLCTTVDEPGTCTEGFLTELARCGADRVDLAPLSEAAVRHVLGVFADGSVPEDRARELHGLSGGNAFLLAQLLKQSPDGGAGGHVRVPPAVQSLVRTRLAELSLPARQVVDSAAVCGDRPDMRVVGRLTGMPVAQVLELADEAVARRLLSWGERESPHQPGGYRFPAGVLLRAVLAELGPARRQTLHAQAAHLLAGRKDLHHAVAAAPVTPTGPASAVEETERSVRRMDRACQCGDRTPGEGSRRPRSPVAGSVR